MFRKTGALFFTFTMILGILAPRPARAVSMGDAALTVSVSTVAGAILGASTLPFYSDSGKHTKNIFYGAAFGAVAGVLVAAFAGVKEADSDEDAFLKMEKDHRFARERQSAPEAFTSLNSGTAGPMGQVLAWSPVADFSF